MVNVDIRGLLLHLNDYCTNALQGAVGFSVSRTHYEVTLEHFFLKLMEQTQADWSLIFQHFEIEVGQIQRAIEQELEDAPAGNSSKPVLSPVLIQLVQDAWLVASIDLSNAKIRSGAILLAFLTKPATYSSGAFVDFIKDINREALVKDFLKVTQNSMEEEEVITPSVGAGERAAGAEDGGFLEKFCVDFTKKARDGEIDPVFGRDQEIRQMIDILARRRKNNPICVGEPGVGKTAVVEGLALRVTESDVPEILQNVRLLGLDMGLLEAGAGVKGEFERRLKGVIDSIKASEQPTILFIDEAHTLIGGGGSAGTSDAANLLKPALARGELRTVAATTWREYKKYFEKDAALERRFQPVKLDEPCVEDTILILRGIKANYEKAHRVIVRDDAVEAAAEMSDRYISGRFLPDKAIDLLDTSCARIKINLSSKPAVLEDKERKQQAIEREIKALERDKTNGLEIDEERLTSLKQKTESILKEAEEIKESWLKEKEAAEKVLTIREKFRSTDDEKEREKILKELQQADRELADIQKDEGLIQIEVTPEVVARVVSDWTGIPLGKVQKDKAKAIVDLEAQISQRIKGQDQALKVMTEVIQAAKAGIKNPNQPMGVFLFVGPSGVGKTETGLVLADILFGSEKNAVTINMSEFQEGHTVSRLIGSPPGYVGFGEGGMLTEAIRQKPYSVVLLDEVEKAHLDVMNLFYQVFDKGMLTDGEGKEINFRNTILILTSNLASDIIQEMTTADPALPLDTLVGAIRPVLSQHFKPALLARMTIVPFISLNPDVMKLITELKLKSIKRTIWDNNKMELSYTPAVVDQITFRCTEVETGARNIEYILNTNILPKLSRSILSHMSEKEMPKAVKLKVDKQGAFTFTFSN
jgi:type VI secretion system protein VasG